MPIQPSPRLLSTRQRRFASRAAMLGAALLLAACSQEQGKAPAGMGGAGAALDDDQGAVRQLDMRTQLIAVVDDVADAALDHAVPLAAAEMEILGADRDGRRSADAGVLRLPGGDDSPSRQTRADHVAVDGDHLRAQTVVVADE